MADYRDIQQFFSLPRSGVRSAESISEALGEWKSVEKVAIAIPDHTRPLDLSSVLDVLMQRVLGNKTVIVGLGLHRNMTETELLSIQRFSPIQHDPTDILPIELDTGERVKLSRWIVEADWSISVGVAELHQYAGVSGGYKGVVVGCGSAPLIAQLHRREMVCAPGVRIGQVEGNPFRNRIDCIGRASNCRVALVHVPAAKCWLFGLPDAVTKEAARLINPWQWVSKQASGAILRVPKSKSSSFYQASRAATYLALSPFPAIKEGGTIVLEATLPEGLGSEEGFVRAMEQFDPPWIQALTGKAPHGAGAQRIVMLALLAQRYRLVLRGCVNPKLFQKLGFDASSIKAKMLPGWLDVTDPFTSIPQWRA
jgi:lactate racemase